MFRKILGALSAKSQPLTPRQGKRILKEDTQNPTFTIKGTGRPGFFIIFGLFFGTPPTLILAAVIFGTPDPENGPFVPILLGLFLIPFFLIGTGAFLTGLFLWFGKTQILLNQKNISVHRELFGKIFQQKSFSRQTLELSFEESHRSNEVPSYKINFRDETPKNKIGVGGSLKEEELLWLDRELKLSLGQEPETPASVIEAISEENVEGIYDSAIDPHYHSKTLRFAKTNRGWEARTSSSFFGSLFLILFGSIFLGAGLIMGESTREFIFTLLPWIPEIFSDGESSGDGPPLWFALIFGGAGLAVMLGGLFALAYRVRISQNRSRLHLERRWLLFARTSIHDTNDFTELEIKQNGHVNNSPRFRLLAHLKNGKKITLLGWSPAEDIGQLHAHISEMMPHTQNPHF